jgi:hypothetical protein
MLCIDYAKVPNTGVERCVIMGAVRDEYLIHVGDAYEVELDMFLSRSAIDALYAEEEEMRTHCDVSGRHNVECVVLRDEEGCTVSIAKATLVDMYNELLVR